MPSPLRIAVLGVGNIGSAFAFQLARVGHHDVTAIARPGSTRLEHLQRDQAIVTVKGERADVKVADALDAQIPYDLVIVTLLAHQAGAVLPALARSEAKTIIFMFNCFDPAPLAAAVGPERCVFGMPFVQATVGADGKLKAAIGVGGQKSKLGRQDGVDLFIAAGLPAVFEPDMPLWLRCHAPMCVAFESVSVAGVRRGGGASWGEAMALSRGIHESYALIRGLGQAIYPRDKARIDSSPVWVAAAILWFVSRIPSFRELLATGAHECRALVDAMLAAAPCANPPVRTSRILAMKPPP